MAKHQHVSQSAHDVSSASAGKLLQTRPFRNEHETENQQPSQVNAQSQSVTGGWDLTPKILSATSSSTPSPTPVVGLPLQAKLTIGEPNDKYEQEADRVAHDVVQRINAPDTALSQDAEDETSTVNSVQQVQRQITPRSMTGGFDLTSKWLSHPSPPPSAFGQPLQAKLTPHESPIQRETQEEDDELQMKPLLQQKSVSSGEASSELESSINRARSGGQPLDANLQQSMGQAMGADFSNVKVHTDATADSLNQSIQAKAFTTGRDVFFRQGTYQPNSRSGQELIAHELTHVVQQSPNIQRSGTAKGTSQPNVQQTPQHGTNAKPIKIGVDSGRLMRDEIVQRITQVDDGTSSIRMDKWGYKLLAEGESIETFAMTSCVSLAVYREADGNVEAIIAHFGASDTNADPINDVKAGLPAIKQKMAGDGWKGLVFTGVENHQISEARIALILNSVNGVQRHGQPQSGVTIGCAGGKATITWKAPVGGAAPSNNKKNKKNQKRLSI